MRKQLLWITLAITIIHSDFAGAQSLPSTSTSKSSHIDLKGLVKRANEGNPVAQSQLGLAYQLGQGVDKDPYEAIRWYRMAANSGDPLAQNNLGYLYETGAEGVKDLVEASKWYARAAVSGNPTSQYNLGLPYLRVAARKNNPHEAPYIFQHH